jgi:CheY-like chemotaxis protein
MSPDALRRILVVDDDAELAEVLCGVLERSGYAVDWARNGREALQRLRGSPSSDLVLLDLMMPDMNGWEFRAEQLKDPQLSSIPVVVFTGQGKVTDTAATIGAAANLRKPVALADLLLVLGQVLQPEARS